ncbi:hypothetical protein [Dyella sp. C11]|uniref:hypothetical protein n=1 Tax=Dyella sp. C11 TaxID=2126991 RepID=UPI000D64E161|nr:hypothetical protein [Dyella sp. C11]
MITIDSKEFRDLIGQAVIQRDLGSYEVAAMVLEQTMPSFDQPAKEIALLQLIYIYDAAGDTTKRKASAEKLAKYDSEIPSVKKVLGTYM